MSIAYLTLRETALAQTTAKYFEWTRNSMEALATETKAIVEIQRVWRGYNARKYVAFLHYQGTEIKRVWRGYKGRQYAAWVRRERMTAAEQAYYDSMATQIQKVYRGRQSRKEKQDFYRRKNYIQQVTQQGKQLVQDSDQYNTALKAQLDAERERKRIEEFSEITGNLHHMVSTANTMGVFNSPYGAEFATHAMGVPLEEHIRTNVHAKLKESGRLKATDPPLRKNMPYSPKTTALRSGRSHRRQKENATKATTPLGMEATQAAMTQVMTEVDMDKTLLAQEQERAVAVQ